MELLLRGSSSTETLSQKDRMKSFWGRKCLSSDKLFKSLKTAARLLRRLDSFTLLQTKRLSKDSVSQTKEDFTILSKGLSSKTQSQDLIDSNSTWFLTLAQQVSSVQWGMMLLSLKTGSSTLKISMISHSTCHLDSITIRTASSCPDHWCTLIQWSIKRRK